MSLERQLRGSAATRGAHGEVNSRTYEAVRELIVTGRLRPGERAVETRLAGRLGVSRTPVRAAIARLAREGFLVPATRGRRIEYTTAPLSVGDMKEIWEIIGALECVALSHVDRLADDDRRDLASDLRSINRDLRAAASARPRAVDRLADLQGAFHARFVRRCAGPHLRKMHEGIRPHLRRYEWVYGTRTDADYESSIDEHEAIIVAIEEGGADRACELIVRHWAGASRRTADVLRVLGVR